MPRKAQPRITRPSGIVQTANGKYFYWKCNVSGKETFADKKRFDAIVKNYGSESNLFKTYVLGPAKKYLKKGLTIDEIKSIVSGSVREKSANTTKQKRAGRPRKTAELPSSGSLKTETKEYYPWSGNSDYFKSEPSLFNVAEESKNACIYPNRNLDDRCFGCSVYDLCQSSVKYPLEDMKKPKEAVKIKRMVRVDSA